MRTSQSATSTDAGLSAASSHLPARQPSQPQPFAGFGRLLRFMVRRDRLRAPIWVAAIVGVFAASVASIVGLYKTASDLQSYAELAHSDAAIKAIVGPGYGLDTPTQGAVVMNEMEMMTFIAIALMCVFMIVRHTRAEEETDRAELVRAAPVGRYATLTAACVWVTLITVVLATALVISLLGFGISGAGTFAFGASSVGIGLAFIGVGAITAQVGSSARTANAAAGIALGASFLLRAVGDLGTGWLTWMSPLGWAQAIRAHADERWWVLIPLIVTGIVLMVTAVILSGRRDLGAGYLRQRSGPSGGSKHLATPFALAARLQRPSVIGWAIGVAIMGFFMGIIADQVDILAENQAVADVLTSAGAGSPTESFLATIMVLAALLVSGFTISTVLRLRAEEFAGRAGPVLATPISRIRWLWSYLGVAAIGSTAIMASVGLLTGIGYALRVGNGGEILPLLAASLVTVPALFVLGAFAVALVGWIPRWSPIAWTGVALGFVVALLAETLKLPQWLRDLSPFQHIPAMPAASFDLLPVALLLAVAAGLTVVGMVTMRHRDIH